VGEANELELPVDMSVGVQTAQLKFPYGRRLGPDERVQRFKAGGMASVNGKKKRVGMNSRQRHWDYQEFVERGWCVPLGKFSNLN
jgi:hypothetical protein